LGGIHPIPIESIRLKLIRAGHQDYELLRQLADKGAAANAYSIAQGLFPDAWDTIKADAQVEAQRRKLAIAVDGLVAPASSPAGDA
jgi:hypothetical protein